MSDEKLRRYEHFNQGNFFFQNVEDLSQFTWQFFETSRNCMTLLWRGQVVVITITYFCTLILNWRNRNSGQGQHTGYALIIFIIGSISVGGLHYRLCYSIKFVITLNEGLGLQLLGFFTGFAYILLKIWIAGLLVRNPWSSVRGPRAPWLLVRGPGGLWSSIRGPRASCSSVGGSGAPVYQLEAPGLSSCRLGTPGPPGR